MGESLGPESVPDEQAPVAPDLGFWGQAFCSALVSLAQASLAPPELKALQSPLPTTFEFL